MHMVNQGRVRWLAKNDVMGQVQFFQKLFGMAAYKKSIINLPVLF